jgi:hypothetical protein
MKLLKKSMLISATVFAMNTITAQEETTKEEVVENITDNTKHEKVKFDVGVDVASRYIWRGLQFSEAPAIQPFIEFSVGNFTLGTWGSYETGGEVVGQELDFYASYAIGPVSIGFTDYSFPFDKFSDGYFNASSHVGEASVTFEGVKKFPLSVMVAVNVYNDDSIYSEISWLFSIKKVDLSLFVGAGDSAYTKDGNYMVNNFGLSASRSIKVTKSYSFALSASAIFNPDSDDAYLVVILSI